MGEPFIEWLLDCEPRPVQEEALLRSYYGWQSRGHRDAVSQMQQIRSGGPAIGWGHLMEMRLGKTPTLLNEILLLEKHQDVKRRVIFSPNSYKGTWAKEVDAFGLLQPTHAFETSKIGKAEEFVDENPDDFILVVNYESLIYDNVNKFLDKLLGTHHRTIVAADESIKIKNHASQITRAAMSHAVEADYVRILTGLPMTQGPQDLYSQLRFIRELNGKNFYSFRNKYCKMGGFKGKKITGVKADMAEELSALIDSTAFVAKRKDWGRVTEPEHYLMDLDLSPKQLKYYLEMEKEFVTILESGEEISVDQVISQMLKLQQISSGFVYDEHGDIVKLVPDLSKTAKMKAVLDLLEDEIPGKVIIPYHYAASGDLLLEALNKFNPRTIRGKQWMKTNNRDVDEEKAIFNEDPKSKVMLLQIQAGKYGHTLVGTKDLRCTHMLFYENTYSLDDRGQIEMRNTAETQDWTNVYMDFVSSPVERNAITALQRKESIVTAVLGSYNPNKEVKKYDGN